MKALEKQWFKVGQVSKITGISKYKIRKLAEKNPNYLKVNKNGYRKINYKLVQILKHINL